MANRMSVTLEDRTVYWELDKAQAVQILQLLIQTLGPAKEDER